MSRQLTENEIKGMHAALDAIIAAAQQDDTLSEGALCLPEVILRVFDLTGEDEFEEPTKQSVVEYGIELVECSNGKFSIETQQVKREVYDISWDEKAGKSRNLKVVDETNEVNFQPQVWAEVDTFNL